MSNIPLVFKIIYGLSIVGFVFFTIPKAILIKRFVNSFKKLPTKEKADLIRKHKQDLHEMKKNFRLMAVVLLMLPVLYYLIWSGGYLQDEELSYTIHIFIISFLGCAAYISHYLLKRALLKGLTS